MSDQGPGQPADDWARGGQGFQRAEAIYFELAGLDPADRADAAIRLCGNDKALLEEVRSLLRSAQQMGAFLEVPVLGRRFDELEAESDSFGRPDELIGAMLGPFKVERRLASGGMGTVYLARRSDQQFEQTVAIKVVKRGLDSEEILRRFREERQTLANLDHANIARLLDAGATPDGRPYLVMEFVDGLPIDCYCDRHKLSTRDRLKLFRLVCESVHAAHQGLVIHRDLKPGNILVTAAGVPKLLDFGIAKVLSPAGIGGTELPVTADTDRRLTPEYASPEQVRGLPITTASDVYSLGVILYELLTGVRPYSFGFKTTEEVRRVVCDQQPSAPSAAVTIKATRLHGKLATNAAPTARPETAAAPPTAAVDHPATRGVTSTRLRSQLRGDIDNIVLMALRKEPQRRYASAEQMAADIGRFLHGMPVQAQRDTVFYRARKFVRRHAVATAITALAAALVVLALIVQTHLKGKIAAQRDELAAANHRLDQTRGFLVSILSGAQASSKGPGATLGDVLEDAALSLQTTPPDDPQTLASTQQAVGGAMMSLGMLDRAEPLLRAAAAEFARLPADSETRLNAELEIAQLLFYRGKAAEAEAALRDLLARERARNSGTPAEREGDILNALGASLRAQRKLDEALTTQNAALAIRTRTAGASSLKAAESHNNIATIHFSAGRFPESVAEYQAALAARRAALRPNHPLVLATLANLGLASLRAGDAAGAVAPLAEAADGWAAAFSTEHPGQASTRTSLGQALRKLARHDESITAFNAVFVWQQAHMDAASPDLAATRANIGITLAEKGSCSEAVPILRAAVNALTPGLPYPGITRAALQALVACHEKLGQTAEAAAARAELARIESQ